MPSDRYLFRGFHKDENGSETIYIDGQPIKGKWVEGYLVEYTYKDIIYMNGTSPKTSYIFPMDERSQLKSLEKKIEVIPETIGQYLNKQDKNDRKIFENDNLKMFQIDYDSETENGYGESTFEYKGIHIKATLDFIYSYEFYGEFLDELEVIGTIFDKEVNDND